MLRNLCIINIIFFLGVNSFWISKFRIKVSTELMMSVSVGPSNQPSAPRKSGFLISPRSNSIESELLIIDNFSQIQQGEMKKIGIIGTQDLSLKHRQMIELLSYALVLSGSHVITSGKKSNFQSIST